MRQRNENAGIAEKGNGEVATDQSDRSMPNYLTFYRRVTSISVY